MEKYFTMIEKLLYHATTIRKAETHKIKFLNNQEEKRRKGNESKLLFSCPKGHKTVLSTMAGWEASDNREGDNEIAINEASAKSY